MATYYEKLRDPRWQKKRLEIMQRDNFECRACGEKSKTLNVHHGYYARKTDPWDYPNNTLWTLCEECHEEAQDINEWVHKAIASMPPGYQSFKTLIYLLEQGVEKGIGIEVERIVSQLFSCLRVGMPAAELWKIYKKTLDEGMDTMPDHFSKRLLQIKKKVKELSNA